MFDRCKFLRKQLSHTITECTRGTVYQCISAKPKNGLQRRILLCDLCHHLGFSFPVVSLSANSVIKFQAAIFGINGCQRSPCVAHMTMCVNGAPGIDWNQNAEE